MKKPDSCFIAVFPTGFGPKPLLSGDEKVLLQKNGIRYDIVKTSDRVVSY
jgi:hypothetical protein